MSVGADFLSLPSLAWLVWLCSDFIVRRSVSVCTDLLDFL